MLRIARRAVKTTPQDMETNCLNVLRSFGAQVAALFPQQRFPYYLATDYFVSADPLTKHHKAGMQRCLAATIGEPVPVERRRTRPPKSSGGLLWWRLNVHLIEAALHNLPEQRAALQADSAGFYSVLDIAMLVIADECIQASNLAELANPLRAHLGKKACHKLAVARPPL